MLNCVTLIGRLTADPELRITTTGKSVANFSIAVDRSYSKSGNKETDFINIVCWEGAADFVSKYFSKGSMIAIQGSIQTRNYEDKNGNKRTAFEVRAREVSFCGSKNETSPAPAQAAPTYSAPADFEEIPDDSDLPF
jgi:single-strand DNA-binding protein